MFALQRDRRQVSPDDFPEQLTELLGYFDGSLPDGHPYQHITAVPARGYRPAVWMLGSSTYGAQAAAVLGMPYSFAYHFAPAMLDDALAAYRRSFRPSPERDAPYVMLGVSVVCGESDEHARWLAAPGALAFLRLRQGRPDVYPTPEEAAEYRFTPFERQQVDAWTRSHVVGGPDSVRERLESLVERTGVDELMVTTMVHAHAERVASYERLAKVFALSATH
jgi:luciferase family oxidoreductase group 1